MVKLIFGVIYGILGNMQVSENKRFLIYVKHIIDEIIFLEQFNGKVANELTKTEEYAIERAFEKIVEASKRLRNSSFIEYYPDVDWNDMARTRDFMAHHYDRVDMNILLRIIKTKLSQNLIELNKILEQESDK